MKTYIRCDAYFSERPHFGPFWIEIDKDRFGEIRTEEPREECASILHADEEVYLLPLLSDTHAHVYMNPWPISPQERSTPGSRELDIEIEDGRCRLQTSLKKGIGLVRDMGDPFGINLAVKKRVVASPDDYPAYQVAGPAIHRPKKYGRFLGVKRETMEEVHALIDELAEKENVDFIKVVSTGIVDFAAHEVKQKPQYTAEELKEVVAHVESLGLRVASHCSGQEGIDNNIAAGIHFVEHAYFIRPDQRAKMRDQGQHWTPTFAPVYQQVAFGECGWDRVSRRNLWRILEEHNQAIVAGHAEGMNILAGTDAGSPGVSIGDGLFVELRSMARSVSSIETLRIATAANADACQHPGYTGRIREKDFASFSVYATAPWQDEAKLGSPLAVYQNGKAVSL